MPPTDGEWDATSAAGYAFTSILLVLAVAGGKRESPVADVA